MQPSGKPSLELEQLIESSGYAEAIERSSGQVIYYQGDPADSLFWVRSGLIKLELISHKGQAAVTTIIRKGEIFGENCLHNSRRNLTATTMSPSQLLRINKAAALSLLRTNARFAETLLGIFTARMQRAEEDLADQIFNSSEKRLARALMRLAEMDTAKRGEVAIPEISHQDLAEMVGTTRSRVSFFMNKFRKRGYIHYRRGESIILYASLRNILEGPKLEIEIPGHARSARG